MYLRFTALLTLRDSIKSQINKKTKTETQTSGLDENGRLNFRFTTVVNTMSKYYEQRKNTKILVENCIHVS